MFVDGIQQYWSTDDIPAGERAKTTTLPEFLAWVSGKNAEQNADAQVHGGRHKSTKKKLNKREPRLKKKKFITYSKNIHIPYIISKRKKYMIADFKIVLYFIFLASVATST